MFESFSESVKYFATPAGALLMVSAVLLGIVFAAAQMGPATRVSEADILGGKRSIQVLQDGSDWLSEAYWERKRAQSLGQLQRPPYRSSKQRSLPLSNRADPKLYRTVCVRLCDGYYFPISFSTTRDRFVDDAQACKARCSSEARLFYHPSDAQDVSQLIDRDGNAYGELANAFLYRTRYDPLCQCRPPPWSEEARQRHAIYATEAWQEKAKKLAEAQVREKAPTNSSTTDTGPSKVNAAAVSGETDATSDTTAYKNMRMGLGRLSGAPPAQAPRVSDSSNRSWRDRVFNTLTD
jgi:hypothetical protein